MPSQESLDSTPLWPERLADFPYAESLLPMWHSQAASADEHWRAYAQALDAYLLAQGAETSLAERYAQLCASRAGLESLLAQGDCHVLNTLLLGRVNADLGVRQAAHECFQRLVATISISDRLTVPLDRPFLPPLPAFDRVAPQQGNIGQWLHAALLEAEEITAADSSYADPQGHLERLLRVTQNPHHSLAMDHRLVLCSLALGRPLEGIDTRVVLHPQTRNPEVWRQLCKAASS